MSQRSDIKKALAIVTKSRDAHRAEMDEKIVIIQNKYRQILDPLEAQVVKLRRQSRRLNS